MRQWVFDRSQFLSVLGTVKPVTGSKVSTICNFIRITVIADENGESAGVYVYATNQAAFICVRYGEIKPASGTFEPGQHSFLLEYKKLVSTLKSSTASSVMITETSPAEYVSSEGQLSLQRNARYTVRTEGNNFFQAPDVLQFPNEEFEGCDLKTYEPGEFAKLWKQGCTAKGELDITKTCLHYDGNFVTTDSNFLCIVQTDDEPTMPDGTRVWASINLESGISDVISKMVGAVQIAVSVENNRVFFIDEVSGIYLMARVSVTNRLAYEMALTNYQFPHNFVVQRPVLSSALQRARAFMDLKHTSGVKMSFDEVENGFELTITTPEDESGQFYSEKVPVESGTGPFDAAYNVINLIKGISALSSDELMLKMRDERQGRIVDRSMCMFAQEGDQVVNILLPSMAVAR